MLPRLRRFAAPLALAGAFGAFFSAGSARAQMLQVSVLPTITQAGSLFTYNYSITNFTPADLTIVNISGLPLEADTATNLMAPAGFQTTFDPGVGIMSFSPTLNSTQAFSAGSTISGFSFSSIFSPSTVSFDTLDVDGNTSTGTTLGPAGAPVPEASTFVSLGIGLSALTFIAVRRRRTLTTATK